MWDELHARSRSNGFTIRSIWIADVAQQAASSVLNEKILGNDRKLCDLSTTIVTDTRLASWYDHSRDLLHMINHFRKEMPMPFVGIGHSMGGCQLANLAYIHPRLFSTLILLDPVIQDHAMSDASLEVVVKTGYIPARLSTYRRDVWPSRAEAEASFLKTPYYKAWDSRVLKAWVKHGLRDTPTLLHPDKKNGEVTLTTTPHNEVNTFLRRVQNPYEDILDLDPAYAANMDKLPFYRNEISEVFHRLPALRPSVLWVFGEKSEMSGQHAQDLKMRSVGTGIGGSGGVAKGRVDKVVLKDIGHLVAMEEPKKCADAAAPWIGKEMSRWRQQLEVYTKWTKLSDKEKITVLPDWYEKIGPPLGKPKQAQSKL